MIASPGLDITYQGQPKQRRWHACTAYESGFGGAKFGGNGIWYSASMSVTAGVVHIYGLSDPRDGSVRYVGKTTQPLSMRLQQHVWNARTYHTNHATAGWIREVLTCGLMPGITLLEDVPRERWRRAERDWGMRMPALTNVAAKLGIGSTRSYVVRWTPELEARLGVDTDESIARDLGITRKAVTYRRRVLDIAANPANGGTAVAKGYRHTRKSGPPRGSHQQRPRAGKDACPRGHPYSGSNVLLKRRGRDCRVCDLARKRAAYAANPAPFIERACRNRVEKAKGGVPL